MEINDNIIELIDENDNVTRFEHLLTLDYDGNEYIIITPLGQWMVLRRIRLSFFA